MHRHAALLLIASLAVACDSNDSANVDASTADASVATDGATIADAASADAATNGWTTLIDGDWSLDRGSEGYECIALTLTEEVYVHAISPIAPLGTHHTVLTTVPSTANIPDGQYPCDGFSVGPHMIYGSGVGTEPLEFPEGVALRLRAGQQILLNLHLFNFDAENGLSGYSAIQIQTMDAADVTDEAEIVLAGVDSELNIPARSVSTQTGTCTFSRAQTIFAVFPHMHTSGTHMRVTANREGEAAFDLMDDDYDFDQQRYSIITPGIEMGSGDTLSIGCTYDNANDHPLRFGESTNDEMCYAGVYRYPAANSATTCTE